MIKQYKEFFLSQDLVDITPYAESIIADDLEAFVQVFEPFADEMLMIDPIEICAAYNAEAIFEYLINTYDYTEFINPFQLTLPMILVIFERENLLFDALERLPFSDEQYLLLYEFMLQTKEAEYFIEYYKAYGIAPDFKLELLRLSLEKNKAFEFLLKQKGFKKHLKHDAIIYEIIAYHQTMIHHIAFIDDLAELFATESFIPVLRIEDEALFKTTIDFMIERHLDVNHHNEFGLTFFHEALRHAAKPSYLYYLQEKGASPFFKTTRGYQSSHQLLFRDAEFTLELMRLIDFEAKDLFGLTLKDYDALQRKPVLQLLDILLVVKLVLNMDESAIYELENTEFYDLSSIHGVDPFINAYSVAVFENAAMKERFKDALDRQVQLDEVHALMHSLDDTFMFEADQALELPHDIIALEEEDYVAIAEFAKSHQTSVKLLTDGVELNKVGHLEIVFDSQGHIHRSAHIHTHLVDVYYVHTYYGIALENITYTPKVSKDQRYLN
ncbi:MAG: hypothetical protein EA374_02595 [Acholeplasmatales bacterium]|nr:MAG: hypothetical protein EA374_02595 [Acholeplasmatales bacterium]